MVVWLALAVASAGLAGVAFAPILLRRNKMRSMGLAFAAGTLLSMILLHVIPEAMEMTSRAALLLVVGFVLMMMLHQRGLTADPCCGHEHAKRAGIPSFLALCLCSVNDGVVLYSDIDRGFASPLLWAMCLHKATASFALLMLLKEVGLWHKKITGIAYMLGFVAVTPVAMLAASQLAGTTEVGGMLLALAAGALLYVVAGSLVPRVEHLAREGIGPVLATFFIAVVVNVGIQIAAPHSHSHTHEVEHPEHGK